MNKNFNSPAIVNYVLPFVGGLLYATGFPMGEVKGLVITPIIGLVLFFMAVHFPYSGEAKQDQTTLKSELLALLCFSIGYCLLGYYWIPYTLKEFGNIPFPFNNAMGVLFSLIIAPQYLLFILVKSFAGRFKFKSHIFFKPRWNRNLFYAFFLTLFEYYTPQQFPAHLGHPWLTIAPYIGLAPYVGAPFFSFMSFWIVLAILDLIKNRRFDGYAIISFIVFLGINISMPLKLSDSPTHEDQIRLVQANIGNFMKIQSEKGSLNSMQDVYASYRKLSTTNMNEKIDLILWPETAYPNLLTSEILKDHPNTIPFLFAQVIDETGAELFVGGYDRNTKATSRSFLSEYNTIFHFKNDYQLKHVYHKIKLIPFGEGLPFGPLNEFLSKVITNVSYFASGDNYTLFKTRNETPFIAHICYEILFSWFTRNYLNSLDEEPNFLVNLTNDSWYGDTSEPYQHLYLAHWRALEFNIPIVRLTNTGITSILFPDGSESKRTPIGEEAVVDFKLETSMREKTFFQRVGFHFTTIAWVIFLTFGFIIFKMRPS